jgi:hypothetical protein
MKLENGPNEFTEATMIALKKKPNAAKCSDHRSISLTAHTARIVARIITGRIGRKTEDVLAEDQFRFGREKGTRDAIGMLRIISERTMNIEEELCVCVYVCVLQRLAESICKCKMDQINADPKGNWY